MASKSKKTPTTHQIVAKAKVIAEMTWGTRTLRGYELSYLNDIDLAYGPRAEYTVRFNKYDRWPFRKGYWQINVDMDQDLNLKRIWKSRNEYDD